MEFNQLELIDEDAFSRQRYLKRLYMHIINIEIFVIIYVNC